MSDDSIDGMVPFDRDRLIELCEARLENLRKAEETDHEVNIRQIMGRNRVPKMFRWFMQPIFRTREQAEAYYDSPASGYYSSARYMTSWRYKDRRDPYHALLDSAKIAGPGRIIYVNSGVARYLGR